MAMICPEAHILASMQSQSLTWWKRLAELIDNALDASASRVSISFKNKILSVADDGIGIRNLLSVVTLGKHDGHNNKSLGRYGIGAKDAWLVTGPVIEIDSVCAGKRRHLRVDVRELMKSNWQCNDPTEEDCEGDNGTEIRISMKPGQAAPQWSDLSERLGWVFAPALLEGKQIVFRDTKKPTPLVPAQLPPLLNAVSDSFKISGKQVQINIGVLPPGVRQKFGPFWIQYRHRMLDSSAIGTYGRCISRVAGQIILGDGWHLAKNKDCLIDEQDELADAIFVRIEKLLSQCESEAEQHMTDILKMEIESLLNSVLQDTKREKRNKTGANTGKIIPTGTGRKRKSAAKTTDARGSVEGETKGRRRGFSIAWITDDEDFFGKFDRLGKTVHLNIAHPVIAEARRNDNKHALLSAASAVIADYDANHDGEQRLLGCAPGAFKDSYVRLMTSLVKAEGATNAV